MGCYVLKETMDDHVKICTDYNCLVVEFQYQSGILVVGATGRRFEENLSI
jgi:hypothetical protein